MNERSLSSDDCSDRLTRKKFGQIPNLFEDYEIRLNSKWTIARRSGRQPFNRDFTPHSSLCFTPGRKYIFSNSLSQSTNLSIDDSVDNSILSISNNSTPLLTIHSLDSI